MAIGLQGDVSMMNWTSGPSSMPTPPSSTNAFSTMGPIFAITGAISSAIGSYYSAKTQQNQLKSQALTMDFQKSISQINARQAEFSAQTMLESGNRQVGVITMRAGNVKSGARASMAARGIQLGEGSAADVIATTDLMKEIDALNISANAVQAAESARTQAQNYQTQATMQGVSSANLLTSAGSISPGMSAGTSLLGSASTIASTYYRDAKMQALADRLGI